jgi:hypothetical protein
MRTLLAALVLLLPVPALACDNAEALLKQAYPEAVADRSGLTVKGGAYAQRIDPEAVACKAWPYRPELTLLAVPLREAAPPVEGEARGDVEIIVADTATGKPLARRREEGMAFEDAIQFRGVALDTARYDVRNGQRAFGLRTRQSGSSQLNPFSEQALWLYTYEGGRIRRVLDGLVTERLNGEYDGDCAGAATTVTRTATIGGAGAGGYRDLVIDQAESTETTTKAEDDCKSSVVAGKGRQVRLVFDGRHYVAAKAAKGEEDGPFSIIEVKGAE